MTRQNLEKLLLKSFRKFDKEIVSLNKQQLSKGEDNEGDLFGRYSSATQEYAKNAIVKPRKSKVPNEPYNFEWTGGLFDGMYLLSTVTSVEIWSKDVKTPLLNIEYPNLFGLNPDNMDKILSEKVEPYFISKVRKQLKI